MTSLSCFSYLRKPVFSSLSLKICYLNSETVRLSSATCYDIEARDRFLFYNYVYELDIFIVCYFIRVYNDLIDVYNFFVLTKC